MTTLSKTGGRLSPRTTTVPKIAIAIKLTMIAYSTAVAPFASYSLSRTEAFMTTSIKHPGDRELASRPDPPCCPTHSAQVVVVVPCSASRTDVKTLTSSSPTVPTIVMMTTAIKATMMPYSTAVAPSSRAV